MMGIFWALLAIKSDGRENYSTIGRRCSASNQQTINYFHLSWVGIGPQLLHPAARILRMLSVSHSCRASDHKSTSSQPFDFLSIGSFKHGIAPFPATFQPRGRVSRQSRKAASFHLPFRECFQSLPRSKGIGTKQKR